MDTFDRILLGTDSFFQTVIRTARIVAGLDVTVLIYGETGTGKEIMARALHQESPRIKKPFVPINCAALPEGLAESVLFGHRRGAFTGASTDHLGHIRAAESGTLFLDEVAELPLIAQSKLLRFLESGECQVVGHSVPTCCNTRILAATHRDLREWVTLGRFREDLYYRLNVVPLELPPLRKRSTDLLPLLFHFTTTLSNQYRLSAPRYASATLALMQRYSWPGNIRELRNLCERMVVLFSGRLVEPDHLPIELRVNTRDYHTQFDLPEKGIILEELEADMIRQALSRTQGNRCHAARLLGLTRDTLLYRIKKYAIVNS